MRYLMLTFLFLNCFIAISQDKSTTGPPSLDFRSLELKVKRYADQALALPFGSIKVIDNRYDTSKIGFDASLSFWNGKTRAFQKVVVKNGLQDALENYYNEYYRNSFSNSNLVLLIVIKKLWLLNVTGVTGGSNGSYYKQLINLPTLKFEYYLVDNNDYYPIKRVDTTYKNGFYKPDNNRSADFRILDVALSDMIEFIDFNKYLPVSASARKRSLSEIETYNRSSFNKPILTDKSYNPGVYVTFSEFINNRPSVSLDKLETVEGYWGHCDGKDIFINHHRKKLFRSGNTFEYFTDKLQMYGTNWLSENGGPRVKGISTPVQLDMDTGKIYADQ